MPRIEQTLGTVECNPQKPRSPRYIARGSWHPHTLAKHSTHMAFLRQCTNSLLRRHPRCIQATSGQYQRRLPYKRDSATPAFRCRCSRYRCPCKPCRLAHSQGDPRAHNYIRSRNRQTHRPGQAHHRHRRRLSTSKHHQRSVAPSCHRRSTGLRYDKDRRRRIIVDERRPHPHNCRPALAR